MSEKESKGGGGQRKTSYECPIQSTDRQANYIQKNAQTQERRRYPDSEFFIRLNEKTKTLNYQ
jgi:hypothetical protein